MEYLNVVPFSVQTQTEATMNTRTLGVSPAGDYQYRAPSPPHIHVPPTPEDQQVNLPPTDEVLCGDLDRVALEEVALGYYTPRAKDWKYEWRRQAQQILGYLFLGPSAAARDLEYLKKQGITMLLVVRDSKSALGNFLSGEKIAKQLGIEAANVDVADTQDLTRRLREAVHIINQHLVMQYHKRQSTEPDNQHWGKVLIFCESGNERSATVVAAYLMAMYDVDAIGAIQYIQAQRFCVAFDDGLKNLLLSYQQLVAAERMTTRAKRNHITTSYSGKSKRGRDDMDEDMEMDTSQADDEARFEGRRVFVPFKDDGSIR